MAKRDFGIPLVGATAILVGMLAAPAAAAPPDRSEAYYWLGFPDFDRGLVVLVNQTRAHYCTDEVVAWEEDVIDWIEAYDAWVAAGEPDPPGEPPFPNDPAGGFPEGIDPIAFQEKETGQGAIVHHENNRGMVAEIWPMIANAPGVGACTDTDPSDDPYVGTGSFKANDNDRFATGTRGNAWGERGTVRAEGHTYTWRFHTNSRCYVPDGELPRCERVTSTFD
jgi:hypothetical protein